MGEERDVSGMSYLLPSRITEWSTVQSKFTDYKLS